MNTFDLHTTRRSALATGVAVAMLAICIPKVASAAKASKRDFSYQDKPKGSASCVSCKLFSRSSSGGVCAIVDGEVSPDGWCMAYSPKG